MCLDWGGWWQGITKIDEFLIASIFKTISYEKWYLWKLEQQNRSHEIKYCWILFCLILSAYCYNNMHSHHHQSLIYMIFLLVIIFSLMIKRLKWLTILLIIISIKKLFLFNHRLSIFLIDSFCGVLLNISINLLFKKKYLVFYFIKQTFQVKEVLLVV